MSDFNELLDQIKINRFLNQNLISLKAEEHKVQEILIKLMELPNHIFGHCVPSKKDLFLHTNDNGDLCSNGKLLDAKLIISLGLTGEDLKKYLVDGLKRANDDIRKELSAYECKTNV